MYPRKTLDAFDRFLAARGLRLDAIVVGGTALNLMGVVSRETRGCDILEPTLAPEVLQSARQFAAEQTAAGNRLSAGWLDNGPAQLTTVLPDGWHGRLQPAFRSRAITLQTLGRGDLLKAKLFALLDRGLDLADCIALRPTAEELAEARPWLEAQGLNPDWPEHVRGTLDDLARRLGHAV